LLPVGPELARVEIIASTPPLPKMAKRSGIHLLQQRVAMVAPLLPQMVAVQAAAVAVLAAVLVA